jgi:multisubunit Na+/H+ antiporter MnhC subunit
MPPFQSSMTVSVLALILIAVVGLAVVFMIARRTLRIMFKLALFAVLLILLLVGAGMLWWNGWFGSPEQHRTERPAPARRSTQK